MSFKDLKTSLLVNKQLPEFVRDEYPKFVTFLEAYYEFLEQSGISPTSNNLVTSAKSLKNIKKSAIEPFRRPYELLSPPPSGIQ